MDLQGPPTSLETKPGCSVEAAGRLSGGRRYRRLRPCGTGGGLGTQRKGLPGGDLRKGALSRRLGSPGYPSGSRSTEENLARFHVGTASTPGSRGSEKRN